MEDEHDLEFTDLLQSYKVKDADNALLERIMAKAADAAADAKVLAFKRPVYANPVMRYAAIAAALAVLGFFCGSASLQTGETFATQTPAATGNTTIDNVIVGPKSYSEITL